MAKYRKSLRTLSALGIISLGGIHMINRSVSSGLADQTVLKPETGQFYHWREGDVFYRVSGSGDIPLLLLHDASPVFSGNDFRRLEKGLSSRFRIYTPDLPGCGNSDKPILTYTNYFYVQLITSFIRDVIGEPAYVAAAGMSVSFAVMAAIASPAMISGLYGINPSGLKKLSNVPDKKSRLVRFLLSSPIIGTCLYNMMYSRRNIEALYGERCLANPYRLTKKTLDVSYAASHADDGKGKYLQACLDGNYLNWNISRGLRLLKCPLVILYGEKALRGEDIAKSYQRLNPSIKIHSISSAKQLPQLENPEEVASWIVAD